MKNFNSVLSIVFFAHLFSCGSNEPSSVKIEETKPNSEYQIAYNIYKPDSTTDNWEIMIMEFDGSNKRNITNNSDVAWTYYALNDRIFFISDRDTAYRNFFLYEMKCDGSDVRKISELRLEDSWMSSRKNGKELVVSGRVGKELRYQLFIIDTETGAYKQITNDTNAMFFDPLFIEDGNQIVCSYQANKRDANTHEELFIMNTDGSDLKQLTFYPQDNVSRNEYGYKAGSARWHPTENFISYVSKQDGKNQILAVSKDGKENWKIHESENSESWHDWSSDGKWLVFNSTDSIGEQFHIMLMNWETKEIKQLTDTTYKSQLGPVFVEQ